MPTAAQIRRTIKAAQDAGLEVTGVEVRPDGSLRVLASAAESSSPARATERETALCDEMFAKAGQKAGLQ